MKKFQPARACPDSLLFFWLSNRPGLIALELELARISSNFKKSNSRSCRSFTYILNFKMYTTLSLYIKILKFYWSSLLLICRNKFHILSSYIGDTQTVKLKISKKIKLVWWRWITNVRSLTKGVVDPSLTLLDIN